MSDLTDAEVDEILKKERAIGEAFSPAAPVTDRDLFAGRTTQIRQLIDLVATRGQHGIIYGERGVGKTSLVSFTSMIVDDTAVRINCDTSDTFGTLWQKVCERVTVTLSRPGVGFAAKEKEVVIAAAEALPKHPGPADIEAMLSTMPTGKALAIFIDEFD